MKFYVQILSILSYSCVENVVSTIVVCTKYEIDGSFLALHYYPQPFGRPTKE
jgi:hypothetical protein